LRVKTSETLDPGSNVIFILSMLHYLAMACVSRNQTNENQTTFWWQRQFYTPQKNDTIQQRV